MAAHKCASALIVSSAMPCILSAKYIISRSMNKDAKRGILANSHAHLGTLRSRTSWYIVPVQMPHYELIYNYRSGIRSHEILDRDMSFSVLCERSPLPYMHDKSFCSDLARIGVEHHVYPIVPTALYIIYHLHLAISLVLIMYRSYQSLQWAKNTDKGEKLGTFQEIMKATL